MKPSFFRPTTILAALAFAAIGVVAVAEPAAAAVTRHDGVTRFNWGRNCESVIYGYPYVEAAAGLVARRPVRRRRAAEGRRGLLRRLRGRRRSATPTRASARR